ncbi:MAG TPA: diacylglycerol kinase [Candidatus Paceibacterota bacterium]|nr:diacylglycerol kinase [Candidatus Paceibacterota bacterium]
MRHRQNLRQSFESAFRGVGYVLRERNFVVQIVIGAIAIAASFFLYLDRDAKIVIFVVAALVLGAEMVNSAIERLLDRLAPERDLAVAEIKEILAGAVLLFAILSIVVGIVVFGPSIWSIV